MFLSRNVSLAAAATLRAIPNAALRLLGLQKSRNGLVLAPDVRASALALRLIAKDTADLDVEEARKEIESQARLAAGPPIQVGAVWDGHIASTPVRHYRPAHATGDLPTVVYFHGGGWATGSLESHDNTCRFLCAYGDVAVISVDYPLAPEHEFPAGLDASDAVTSAVLVGEVDGIDPARVAFAGDSFGATLSAALCLRRAARGESQPTLQVLIVPSTNLATLDTPSQREFDTGTYLTRKQLEYYRELYTSASDDLTNWEVSPSLAPPELLARVAPAYIAAAGFDPLRDEAVTFARSLVDVGVHATVKVYDSLTHPFANAFYVWKDAAVAMHQIVGAVRFALAVDELDPLGHDDPSGDVEQHARQDASED